MGYKHYNCQYNWIGTSFGHNSGHTLLQESLVCVKHMSDNYLNYFMSLTGQVLSLLNMISDTLFL